MTQPPWIQLLCPTPCQSQGPCLPKEHLLIFTAMWGIWLQLGDSQNYRQEGTLISFHLALSFQLGFSLQLPRDSDFSCLVSPSWKAHTSVYIQKGCAFSFYPLSRWGLSDAVIIASHLLSQYTPKPTAKLSLSRQHSQSSSWPQPLLYCSLNLGGPGVPRINCPIYCFEEGMCGL